MSQFEDRAQQLLARFAGCPIRWIDDPGNYRFLRLTTKPSAGGSLPSTPGFMGKTRTLVGVARNKQRRELLLMYCREDDFQAEAYKDFPADPTAKPTEAVDSRIFLEAGQPKNFIPDRS